MSLLHDLISKHCPDGVQTKTLDELGEFSRGRRFTKNDVVTDGSGVPSIHYGEIYTRYGTWADTALSFVREDLRSQLRFARKGDVVIAGVGETVEDVAKAVAWLGPGEVAYHDDCYAFRHTQNPKYIAYIMQTADFHAQKNKHVARGKVKRLRSAGLAQIKIPVAPLPVQTEIVRILDLFAELEARRRQHAHYRDQLLSFQEVTDD